jgi:hypothetical protein
MSRRRAARSAGSSLTAAPRRRRRGEEQRTRAGEDCAGLSLGPPQANWVGVRAGRGAIRSGSWMGPPYRLGRCSRAELIGNGAISDTPARRPHVGILDALAPGLPRAGPWMTSEGGECLS